MSFSTVAPASGAWRTPTLTRSSSESWQFHHPASCSWRRVGGRIIAPKSSNAMVQTGWCERPARYDLRASTTGGATGTPAAPPDVWGFVYANVINNSTQVKRNDDRGNAHAAGSRGACERRRRIPDHTLLDVRRPPALRTLPDSGYLPRLSRSQSSSSALAISTSSIRGGVVTPTPSRACSRPWVPPEVSPRPQTSEEARANAVRQLSRGIGKCYVRCHRHRRARNTRVRIAHSTYL